MADVEAREGRDSGRAADAGRGLGGWLILVGLVIAVALMRQVAILGMQYLPMLFDGSWEALTRPGQQHYNPLWQPLLIGEIAVNAVLLLLWAYIAWLFLARSHLFPPLLRFGLVASIVFIVVEAFVLKTVLSNARVFSAGTLQELCVFVAIAAVSIPYIFYSRRVKETFVN